MMGNGSFPLCDNKAYSTSQNSTDGQLGVTRGRYPAIREDVANLVLMYKLWIVVYT